MLGSACDKGYHDDPLADLAQNSEIAALGAKLEALERQQNAANVEIGKLWNSQVSLSNTVTSNAKIANQNAVKNMNLRGGCGNEWVKYPDGTQGYRPRRCTEADLEG